MEEPMLPPDYTIEEEVDIKSKIKHNLFFISLAIVLLISTCIGFSAWAYGIDLLVYGWSGQPVKFLSHPFIFTCYTAPSLIAVVVFDELRTYSKSGFLKTVAYVFLVFPLAPFVATLVWALPHIAHALTYLIVQSTNQSIKGVGIIVVVILGIACFIFRLRWQWLYGLTEIVFAGCVAWIQLPSLRLNDSSITPHKISEFALPLVSASIYLIVRGLDNMHKGRTENRKWADYVANILRPLRDRMRLRLKGLSKYLLP
jgi:hypothetical protein